MNHRPTRKRLRRAHFGLLLAAAVLVPTTLFGAYAMQSYGRTLADADQALRRRAAVLAEHVARVFDTHAMLIDFIEAKLEGRGFAGIDRDPGVTALLSRQAERSALVTVLLVMDDGGTIISASLDKADGQSSATRDYFTQAPELPALYVGEQFIGRVSGRPVFSLSRRRADGGVIAAMPSVDYFANVFENLAGPVGSDGVVALYRADGKQLARLPRLSAPVNLPPGTPGLLEHIPAKEGSYRIVPVVGTGERLFGFHQVPGYPVWLTNGVDVATIRSDWMWGLVPQAVLSVAAALFLAAGSGWLLHREHQTEAINARLEGAVAQRTAEAEQRAIEATDAAMAREAALEEAQRAHAAKSHFLAAASHDLRQPVQGLRLFFDVLDQRLTQGEDRRVLALAGKALEGAEELLSTLLDVATLEAGMVAAHPGAVELAPMLTALACEFAPQAAARGLRLRAVPSGLWVHTDSVLLARVLRNLLTNALRYTSSGAVLLGCRRQGGMALIQVWDTGPGIPEDKQASVFEDFVQLGNPERDRTKGLGLGLAVARRMAILMGHRLSLHSVPGRGTMFCFALPITAPPLRKHTSGERALLSV